MSGEHDEDGSADRGGVMSDEQPCKVKMWMNGLRSESALPRDLFGVPSLDLDALERLLPPECWCRNCLGVKFLSGHPDVSAAFLPDDPDATPRLLTPGELEHMASTGQCPPGQIYIYRLDRVRLPYNNPGVEAVAREIRADATDSSD